MEKRNQLQLTILMPCRNEEGSVGLCVSEVLQFMSRHSIDGEVLVVDNDSTDASAELARAAGARVIHEPRPGYGSALQAGIAQARGKFIIMGDADGEYPFSEATPLWECLNQDGYDFVCGDRLMSNEEPGASTFLNRYIGAPGLSLMGRLLFSTNVRDFHCGLRGFNTEAVQSLELRSTGMEFASEMVARFALADMTIAPNIAIRKRKAFDPNRQPHLRRWRDGLRHVRLMLQLFWRLRIVRR